MENTQMTQAEYQEYFNKFTLQSCSRLIDILLDVSQTTENEDLQDFLNEYQDHLFDENAEEPNEFFESFVVCDQLAYQLKRIGCHVLDSDILGFNVWLRETFCQNCWLDFYPKKLTDIPDNFFSKSFDKFGDNNERIVSYVADNHKDIIKLLKQIDEDKNKTDFLELWLSGHDFNLDLYDNESEAVIFFKKYECFGKNLLFDHVTEILEGNIFDEGEFKGEFSHRTDIYEYREIDDIDDLDYETIKNILINF